MRPALREVAIRNVCLVGGDIDKLEVLVELQVIVAAILALCVVELIDPRGFCFLLPFPAFAAPRCGGSRSALRFFVS